MSPLATLLWLINLIFDTAGQLALKAASLHGKELDGFARWKAMAANIFIWIGIGCFVGEFFFWLSFLSLVPLSQGVLVGCVNILGVMIGGKIFFNEKITLARAGAISLIALGVALVGWGGA